MSKSEKSFEISRKIEKVQNYLNGIENQLKVDGIRFRGVDWFAWITAGGDSSVIFSNEVGVAEILITATRAFLLTNEIESERLVTEELNGGPFDVVIFPWVEEQEKRKLFIRDHAKHCLSDRPENGEQELPSEILKLKLELMPSELQRYRQLGREAAEAMTEALSAATPEMTERELAGLGARALWARGIHPLLTLVGGEQRSFRYRHPVATDAKLENHAMLVFCGRRSGLFANLTRHVFFRPLTSIEKKRNDDVAEIEAEAFRATLEERNLSEIYSRLEKKYADLGHSREISLHHQGGPTGYLSREAVARPGLTEKIYTGKNRAFAWNPSLPGAKIEDTVFLNEEAKIEVLTVDATWPTREVDGRLRPDVWARS